MTRNVSRIVEIRFGSQTCVNSNLFIHSRLQEEAFAGHSVKVSAKFGSLFPGVLILLSGLNFGLEF